MSEIKGIIGKPGVSGAGKVHPVVPAASGYSKEQLDKLLLGDWASCQDVPFRSSYMQVPVEIDPKLTPGEWALRNRPKMDWEEVWAEAIERNHDRYMHQAWGMRMLGDKLISVDLIDPNDRMVKTDGDTRRAYERTDI